VIPATFLQAWRVKAPWPDLRHVEQDLIISRALCDLLIAPALKGKIAFRGGTAIHELLFKQLLRYSEDIDLVQIKAEPIGATVDAIREALSWLGRCQRERADQSMHLVFTFTPEVDSQATLKLTVEINTREHTDLLSVPPPVVGLGIAVAGLVELRRAKTTINPIRANVGQVRRWI